MPASLSVTRPLFFLAIVVVAALGFAACGGSDADDAQPPGTTRSERPDRPSRDTPPADDAMDDEPAEQAPAAPDFPLDRTFADVVGIEGAGILSAVSAQPRSVEEVLRGFTRANGAAWPPDDLAVEVGLLDNYQAVYTTFDPESLIVVTMEVLRFADPSGAERFVELVRDLPLAAGDDPVVVPTDVDLPGAVATTYNASRDPTASIFATVAALRGASVVVAQGHHAVRVTHVRGGLEDPVDADAAALIAQQQLERLRRAAEGDLQPLLAAPVPVFDAGAVADLLPDTLDGYARLDVQPEPAADPGDETVQEQVIVRYASAGGELLVAVISAFDDAGAIRITDFAILEAGALLLFTGAGVAFDILDAQQLNAPNLPGSLGTSARWQIRADQDVLWDDILAFRRETIWVILQGISAEPGATPIVDLGFAIDDAIQIVEAQS